MVKKKTKKSPPKKSTQIEICIAKNCKNKAEVSDYCRLHYLKNWEKLKRKEDISGLKKLNKFIEKIVQKHPKNFKKVLKNDVKNDESWEETKPGKFKSRDLDAFDDELFFDMDIDDILKGLKMDDDY